MNEKKIIGVTGGVGSGKSRVLEILQKKYKARVILADEVAHRLMEPGALGLIKITEALGRDFLKEDGSVDRKALAERIFHDEEARKTVDSIIHPMTVEAIEKEAMEAEEELVVIEAAVVKEKVHDICREMWYVYTSREKRIARLMEGRGYTREKCEAIMANQMSEEEFRAVCQREIDNNGSLEETEKQIEEQIRRL